VRHPGLPTEPAAGRGPCKSFGQPHCTHRNRCLQEGGGVPEHPAGPLSTAALDHGVRGWFARDSMAPAPGAAAHAFRHTVTMQLIRLGESATVVQDLLGRASLSSTQVYTKAAGRLVRATDIALAVRQLVRDFHETSPVTD